MRTVASVEMVAVLLTGETVLSTMVAVAAEALEETEASAVALARVVEFWDPMSSQPVTGPAQTEEVLPEAWISLRRQVWKGVDKR